VIDAVKAVSRVAWILLGNATLASVQDGVLTLAFEREGDAKGFASSGSGDFLAKVLDTMFGVRLTVRTTVQAAAGNGGAGGRAPEGSDRPRAAGADGAVRAGDGVASSAPDVARTSGLRADAAENPVAGPGAAGGEGDSAVVSGARGPQAGRSDAGSSPAGSDAPADALAGSPVAATGSGAGDSASGHSPGAAARAGSAAPRSGGQRAGGSARRPRASVTDPDDPRPMTDATPTGEDAGDLLTGTDLIARALGGRMIGETSDS
jgi:hypothetical protein